MTKEQLTTVIQSMKKLWAQSLAQCDNTSGRRGIPMQMEAVEEMCAFRINPMVEQLLAELELQPVAQPATLALPVVSDPRELSGRQKRHKPRHAARNSLRLVV
jgi:hypothetical protein